MPKCQSHIQQYVPQSSTLIDPSKVPYLDSLVTDLQPVPGFNRTAEIEFKIFEQQYREVTVTQTGLIVYWKSVKEHFAVLSLLSLHSLSVPPGSVDTERSFSAWGNILNLHRLTIS